MTKPLHLSQMQNDTIKMAKTLYRDGKSIKKWVRNNSGSRQDAEDLLQDAIIAMITLLNKKDFELTGPPQNLLFGIARKMWFYELRKRNQGASISIDEIDIPEELDEAWFEKERKFQSAEKSLSQLGNKCRELLEMFYLKRTSMEKIAELLGFRNQHVAKAMKFKCLEQAKQLIKNQML